MWAGYDPKDNQKNLEYYKTRNKRFVASPEHGNDTVDDIYNKYQACLLFAAVTVCSGLQCLVLSTHTNILLLSKQDWSRAVRKGFVGPITCIQDLLDFYVWYAQRMSNNGSGALTVSRSWEHISLLGYFHGYIKASEWQRGRYIPAEAMHGITFRRDITRQANINAKEVAQTADDGYEASNKKYLEDNEMAEILRLSVEQQVSRRLPPIPLFRQFWLANSDQGHRVVCGCNICGAACQNPVSIRPALIP